MGRERLGGKWEVKGIIGFVGMKEESSMKD
jgi:hypothetical protein